MEIRGWYKVNFILSENETSRQDICVQFPTEAVLLIRVFPANYFAL